MRARATTAGAKTVAASAGSNGSVALAPPSRPVALALARVHLRLGSLALARVELEMLDRAGELDLPGRIDLAEVRWRMGDLARAGEAAADALSSGDEDPMALTIAAEAAAADGRPNEARRLATRAIERATVPVDELFAGMPRSGVWPADAAEPPPTTPTLFHHEPAPLPNLRAGETDPAVAAARASSAGVQAATEGPEEAEAGATPLALWGSDVVPGPTKALPDPADELDAGRAAVGAGAVDEGLLRFGLVLRLAPALAPAVLQATEGLVGPAADLVRGDAYRLVGLEEEARRSFAAAAWSGERDRRGRGPKTSDEDTSA